MRYKGLDLNLLVALDRLLAEKSVSRAGEKLYRSQSTVSGALARLREYFEDDLLVPVGRAMVPTPRGEELGQAVREILLQIEAKVMTRPDFDPATADRSISLFSSDYLLVAGLADALRVLQDEAPGLRFNILQPSQVHYIGESPWLALERGAIDLLIMPEMFISPQHPSESLFTESFCCIVCADNGEVGDSLSMEEFLKLPHIVVSFGEAAPSYESWFREKHGEIRRVEVVAGSFATVPFLVAGTRRIAMAHRRLAESYARMLPIRIVELPFEVPQLVEAVQWHSLAAGDTGLMWIKDQIVQTLAEPGYRRARPA